MKYLLIDEQGNVRGVLAEVCRAAAAGDRDTRLALAARLDKEGE